MSGIPKNPYAIAWFNGHAFRFYENPDEENPFRFTVDNEQEWSNLDSGGTISKNGSRNDALAIGRNMFSKADQSYKDWDEWRAL